MEKKQVSSQCITIANPSQLVLGIDDFYYLSKKLPSGSNELKQKEETILNSLNGLRKIEFYDRILMFKINLDKVADFVNRKYEDGIDLEEDTIIRYPFDRTIRTMPKTLEEPTKSLSNSITIQVGNYNILAKNDLFINKTNDALMSFDSQTSIQTPRSR